MALCRGGRLSGCACAKGLNKCRGVFRTFIRGLAFFAFLSNCKVSRLTCITSGCKSGSRHRRMSRVLRY